MTDTNNTDIEIPDVLFSEYESIPTIAGILHVFLDSLPDMVETMHAAMDGGDSETLASLAHQIKGAGGGYGYPSITEAALKLEHSAKESDWELARLHLVQLELLCVSAYRGKHAPAGG
ncbi:MAG: Hpt domain-containing protein [Phycisphaerae bacterium]|nr:Hpt domain-containing protein [Phycisphaerae bacterium]